MRFFLIQRRSFCTYGDESCRFGAVLACAPSPALLASKILQLGFLPSLVIHSTIFSIHFCVVDSAPTVPTVPPFIRSPLRWSRSKNFHYFLPVSRRQITSITSQSSQEGSPVAPRAAQSWEKVVWQNLVARNHGLEKSLFARTVISAYVHADDPPSTLAVALEGP